VPQTDLLELAPTKTLKLVPETDPILRRKAEKFDFQNLPIHPEELARQLADTMVELKGLGLSACQVGLPYNVFVMGSGGGKVYACFNPRIVNYDPRKVKLNEGCLTFPNVFIEVERSAAIKVRFTHPSGETVTETFAGLTARIFQHEYDHLQGVLFKDRVSPLTFDIARRKARKAMRQGKGIKLEYNPLGN